MVFAHDKGHVRDILKEMCDFMVKTESCAKEYILNKVATIREAIKNNTIKIERIVPNQVFKIGWADNDDL